MNGAQVMIGTGLVELVGKAVLGIQRRGTEQPHITEYRVRLIVEIGSSHSRAHFHCDRGGRKHEVLGRDLDCRAIRDGHTHTACDQYGGR